MRTGQTTGSGLSEVDIGLPTHERGQKVIVFKLDYCLQILSSVCESAGPERDTREREASSICQSFVFKKRQTPKGTAEARRGLCVKRMI